MKKNHSKAVLSFFFFFCVKILFTEMGMAENISIPVNVGVVLDLGSDLDGKIALSCIEMALSDFYATHGDYKTRLVLSTRDSMKDVVGAAAAALELIKNMKVQAILGPTTSMQASFVIDLGKKAQVPIISFSASSPSLTSIRSTYFVRATLNDSTQVNAISELVKTYKWREAVPIYMDNEYGEGIIPYLIDALQAVNARVPYRSVISPSATDDRIVVELYKLMGMQTRVFIVHMYGYLGTRIFAKAKEIGMMSEGYVWIMTDGLTADLLSSPNPSVTGTMQGVLGVKSYVPSTKELQDFRVRWKRKFQQDNPYIIDAELNIYGLRGYDAATALALAVEKTGTTNFGFLKANVSSTSSTDLASLGVSFNGPSLLQALSNTSFKGLTGNYHFVDGQLQSPVFQIVNVNGNGGREIGFWTPKKGLVKQWVPSNGTNSTSVSGISTVIFPGDTTVVPKGWGIPTNEKKLMIGVPVKSSLRQFVDVINNPSSNTTTVTGFCIDVFDTVVKTLPYDLPYEYVPFAKPDGEPAGSYNDLVYQVYLKNFDAVVGDITILYSRSLFVDYTLPYMESSVSVVVPTEGHNIESAWFFLKPLTWDLWVSTLIFFVFIGFVVWVLEHRINGDFRGPASNQAGTIFWFSFSTMVFSQRERVVSNLSRVVVIIWCFAVLILTQSYTATALALAVEKSGTKNFGFRKANVSSSSSTDLATDVSLNGPNLLQALSNTSFKGLTGDYHFVKWQLQPSAFQIVNVNGNGGRGTGFWTPIKGLVKQLVPSNGTNSTSLSGISTVIFPGDTTVAPKGWGIPTKEKKLRIGVPKKSSFKQFVDVIYNPSSKTTNITGFCIDVFDTAVKALPYDLPYEYVPFAKPDGEPAGTYNDLVNQVYLKNFDAAVGDITILYSRSLFVDYTLPYIESSVSVVVPIEGHTTENALFFLKPLTTDLWVSTLIFFVFIGFVVWVLEHRINGDFRGPASNQAGTIFWFSFSTMVFSQRERVVSNLSRVVVIIWCFVVLILTQSYTASLSSLLTVQQLKVADVNKLIKKGEYVGYHHGSSVLGILLGMGFDKSRILAYNSPEECHELFSKGSGNGGIAAAFEEELYMKLFLSKYCPKYTVIDALFKTGGLGFVFPKGSPLVPEISMAILNMTEGHKMKEIQDKWFGIQTSCPNSGTSVPSNSLSMKTFWGLFLISGIAALLALIIFIVMFVHQEWRVVLGPSDSTTSIWSKIRHLFSIFNQRDLTSHTFKKSEADERNGIHLQSMGAASQSGYSVHTEFHGYPSSAGCVSSRNTQSRRVVISSDQLTNPNQERPAKENPKSNVNHQTPTRTDQRCNTIIHQRSKSY